MERSCRKPLRTLLLAACAWGFLGLFAASSIYSADGNGQAPPQPPAQPPTLDVQRDKEKTVYSIGTSDRDSRKDDSDRAWQMLNNMMIDNRGTRGKGPDNNR